MIIGKIVKQFALGKGNETISVSDTWCSKTTAHLMFELATYLVTLCF